MFQISSFKIICTDSTEILFSQILLIFSPKLGSARLNFHMPKLSFFTDPYCAGVTNKHCLLTFFIVSEFLLLRCDPVISSLNKLKESHNIYNIDRKGKKSNANILRHFRIQ